jgi:hypothetical protein
VTDRPASAPKGEAGAPARAAGRARFRPLDVPEVNVGIFAFLLNYPWEFLQVPFFQAMPDMPHWEAVEFCTRAAVGDAAIAVVAFWCAAAAGSSRQWIRWPTLRTTAAFLAAGLAITLVFERLATGTLDRWTYSEMMPIVPVVGVGLVPLVQWTVLPLLVVWFVRRQLRGATVCEGQDLVS